MISALVYHTSEKEGSRGRVNSAVISVLASGTDVGFMVEDMKKCKRKVSLSIFDDKGVFLLARNPSDDRAVGVLMACVGERSVFCSYRQVKKEAREEDFVSEHHEVIELAAQALKSPQHHGRTKNDSIRAFVDANTSLFESLFAPFLYFFSDEHGYFVVSRLSQSDGIAYVQYRPGIYRIQDFSIESVLPPDSTIGQCLQQVLETDISADQHSATHLMVQEYLVSLHLNFGGVAEQFEEKKNRASISLLKKGEQSELTYNIKAMLTPTIQAHNAPFNPFFSSYLIKKEEELEDKAAVQLSASSASSSGAALRKRKIVARGPFLELAKHESAQMASVPYLSLLRWTNMEPEERQLFIDLAAQHKTANLTSPPTPSAARVISKHSQPSLERVDVTLQEEEADDSRDLDEDEKGLASALLMMDSGVGESEKQSKRQKQLRKVSKTAQQHSQKGGGKAEFELQPTKKQASVVVLDRSSEVEEEEADAAELIEREGSIPCNPIMRSSLTVNPLREDFVTCNALVSLDPNAVYSGRGAQDVFIRFADDTFRSLFYVDSLSEQSPVPFAVLWENPLNKMLPSITAGTTKRLIAKSIMEERQLSTYINLYAKEAVPLQQSSTTNRSSVKQSENEATVLPCHLSIVPLKRGVAGKQELVGIEVKFIFSGKGFQKGDIGLVVGFTTNLWKIKIIARHKEDGGSSKVLEADASCESVQEHVPIDDKRQLVHIKSEQQSAKASSSSSSNSSNDFILARQSTFRPVKEVLKSLPASERWAVMVIRHASAVGGSKYHGHGYFPSAAPVDLRSFAEEETSLAYPKRSNYEKQMAELPPPPPKEKRTYKKRDATDVLKVKPGELIKHNKKKKAVIYATMEDTDEVTVKVDETKTEETEPLGKRRRVSTY